MTVPFNDLSRALRVQDANLMAAFEDVVASGWLVHGPHHAAFQDELAQFVGVKHARGVASGTDALELVIRAVANGRTGSVVTVANAGGYTTSATRAAGLIPIYCDVDPSTHCLDATQLERVLDDSVLAVVVTHLYGRCAPVRSVREICEARGIAVIEDCAQAIGAWSSEGRAGSLGHAATFSFYPTKNLGALGDGGAVVSDDGELIQRIAQLGQYGWGDKYQVVRDGGRNSRLDELQASVLRYRLPLVEEGNAKRRAIIRAYGDAAATSLAVLPAEDGHAGHLAVVVDSSGVSHLAAHLDGLGIGNAVHYPIPDYAQPIHADTSASPGLPATEALRGCILSLPCYPELTNDEVEAVCRALASYDRGEFAS